MTDVEDDVVKGHSIIALLYMFVSVHRRIGYPEFPPLTVKENSPFASHWSVNTLQELSATIMPQ